MKIHMAAMRLLVGLLLGIWLCPGAATAQVPAGAEALIEEAEKSGMTVIVISPEAAAPAAAEPVEGPDGFATFVALVTTEIREIAGSWSVLRQEARAVLAAHGGPDGASWIVPTVLLGLVPLAIGAVTAGLLGAWLRSRRGALAVAPVLGRTDRLLRLFALTAARVALLAVLLVVALGVGAFIREGSTAWQATVTTLLLAAAIIGAVWIVLTAFLAPREPALRVVPLSDDEALGLRRDIMIAIVIGVVLSGVFRWLSLLGVPRDAMKPPVILSMLVSAIALSTVALLHRGAIGRMIVGTRGSGIVSGWRIALARVWPWLAVAYFLLSWLVGSVRLLLDRPNALGLAGIPILIVLGCFALYGVLLLVVDLLAARRAGRQLVATADVVGAAGAAHLEPAVVVAAVDPPPSAPADVPVLQRLLERAAAVISFAAGVYLLSELWGLDQAAGEAVSAAIIEIIVVLLLAYLGYQAARLWIDRKIEDDVRLAIADEHSAGGVPSRLGTLLPILRNFLLVSIGVMAALIVLSRMGVNIGPLLAGAGVVGLAIGFGAQTLVKDIISGAFFLVDDAFRVGEYIDLGGSKGTVEKISIRSMQLRHQNGPLNTVPFGSIGEVSNFSRDWAVMKLPLRVTYDTDVEKVRKLIKKLGEELLQDPELGKYFLQPLKSQGITAMEDSAMVIRLKFMTHPAHQSEVRKAVYSRVQNLFQREGIRFAQKEVRVRITDSDGGEPSAEQRQAAAKAAAQAVVDDDDMRAALQPAGA